MMDTVDEVGNVELKIDEEEEASWNSLPIWVCCGSSTQADSGRIEAFAVSLAAWLGALTLENNAVLLRSKGWWIPKRGVDTERGGRWVVEIGVKFDWDKDKGDDRVSDDDKVFDTDIFLSIHEDCSEVEFESSVKDSEDL